MNKVVKNYILYLAYEVVAVAVPMFTAPYLTRTLHADNYGIYSVVYSSLSLIQSISLMGLFTYGSRQTAYIRDNKPALSAMFRELMVLRLICGIAGSVVFFLYGFSIGYGLYFVGFYAYYLANVFDVGWIFAGSENMLPCVIKNIAAKVTSLVFTFVFVNDENDVLIYILVVAVPMLVANLSLLPLLRKLIGKAKPVYKNIPKHMVSSFSLCLPYIVSQIYLQVDKIMLERITGSTSQVSFYDQAEKIVLIPLSIITSLSAVVMPRIANEYVKHSKKEIENHLVVAGKYSVFIAFPMMFGMMVLAKYFIPWYLGDEYGVSATIIIILSPMVVLNSLSGISGQQYFMATNQIGIMLKSSIFASLINIILNVALIPFMGCAGAAIATLFANLVVVVVQYAEMCKQICFNDVWKAATKYFFYAFIMFGIVILETILLDLEPCALTTAIQILSGIAAYFAVVFIAKDEFATWIVNSVIRNKK